MKVYRVIIKEGYRDTVSFDFESGSRAGDFARELLDHHRGGDKLFVEMQVTDSESKPETYIDYMTNKKEAK
jgi:hypothetical protein